MKTGTPKVEKIKEAIKLILKMLNEHRTFFEKIILALHQIKKLIYEEDETGFISDQLTAIYKNLDNGLKSTKMVYL